MKIAVLGTGQAGQRVATGLSKAGHDVCLGSRTSTNEVGQSWARDGGAGASSGSFAEAAAHGEWIFLMVKGEFAEQALEAAGREQLAGKIVVDVTNPLDFSRGFPPVLFISGHDSLGERLQRAFPEARFVKVLNTTSSRVMVQPSLVPGEHELFICGEDAVAKEEVKKLLLDDFGWAGILDLGGIESARALEALLLAWTRLYRALGTDLFNFHIAR